MTKSYYHRSNCRLCGGSKLTSILKFKSTPPANSFITKEKIGIKQSCFPLELFFCNHCTHVQLLDVVDPTELFENYVYVSGTSQVFVNHFEKYVEYILTNFPQKIGSLVIDIGSNDGTLLKIFKQKGIDVLGIDPAKKIAEEASQNGIETIPAFFNLELSEYIKQNYGKASIITANNVFAHIDDLTSFVNAVSNVLDIEGIFVFEVSYLVDVIEKTLFDMTYHEHLSYHSVKPLIDFFKKNEMELIDVIRVNTHGGSIRGVVKQKNSSYKIKKTVGELCELERKLKLDKIETYKKFEKQIETKKQELQQLLLRLKNENKRIAGYGAPAKLTTLLYHFDIDNKVIDFIVEDNPLKQGKFSPGMNIPILTPEEIYNKKPDYLIILAWNFAESIIEKHHSYLKNGGHFIIPLPNLEVR